MQGDFAAAASNLQTCLSVLGRALPASRLDLACSLSWNVIRYSLQKLALVRWLLKRTSHQWRAREATAGSEDEAKTSARDAALAYHKLHQLHITGKAEAVELEEWARNIDHCLIFKLGSASPACLDADMLLKVLRCNEYSWVT